MKKKEASSSAKVFCLIAIFVLIYGRMIFSTFSIDSGFTQKISANITDVTIYGGITGKYFDKKVLKEAKDVVRLIFEQDSIRFFNSTGVKNELAEARKEPKARELQGKPLPPTRLQACKFQFSFRARQRCKLF